MHINVSGGNSNLKKADGQKFTINFFGRRYRMADGTISNPKKCRLDGYSVVSVKVVQDCTEKYVSFKLIPNQSNIEVYLNQKKLQLELGNFKLVVILKNRHGRTEVHELKMRNYCVPKQLKKGDVR